ncbi:glycolate oxidase subunit GlcE [Ramlibacter sp. 2FC]|uniref:glycolate oxidase subunit GlcE n=1 Tax=Ramlibacter sp. 2FC TaxID=2502188 RepID=UPI0010FA34A1|nr:glycolate oxidase subunit GlcE [Ramlibacter sp. 2FC]
MDSALQTLTETVREAAAHGQPLRIRGGGSKDFYGQSLVGEPLDTRALSGIVSYEPSELVVTARAGQPLAELEAALAERGQCLPFEPPHFGPGATVGGMVASGLNGPARASVGAVRDYVLGLSLLNGRAELLSFGGQVMKNVAGYDLSRLMAGALGTLGLIVEVSLKVLPMAPAEATLWFDMDEDAARIQLNRWGGQPLPINACCWQAGRLALRLRGARAAVAAAQKTMGGQAVDGAADPLWQNLREQTLPFFASRPGQALWRLSLPDTAAALDIGPTLVEWGGAQRWVWLPVGDAERVRAAAARAGGHATLFRGGDDRTPVFTPLAPPLDRIHRELKAQFDPAGIFNRGRLYSEF